MTAPISDTLVTPIASELVVCLSTQMASLAVPPASTCLRWGDRVTLFTSTTYDECCAGLAWVRFIRMYPASVAEFPTAQTTSSKCGTVRWAVEFELGSARCAPVSGAETVPTCDDWINASVMMMDDMAAMRRAVCCFRALDSTVSVVDGEVAAGTTEGGCVSAMMRVIVSARPCDCQGMV